MSAEEKSNLLVSCSQSAKRRLFRFSEELCVEHVELLVLSLEAVSGLFQTWYDGREIGCRVLLFENVLLYKLMKNFEIFE